MTRRKNIKEVETEIRAAVSAAQTKMQEVETEIRAAVAAAQARGLVLTRGVTNDGERCCLLGAFAEGPSDVVDTLNMLEARWGLDEEDLCDIMGVSTVCICTPPTGHCLVSDWRENWTQHLASDWRSTLADK